MRAWDFLSFLDGVSDMHCMSDMYLADELKQKYADKIKNR